MHTVTDIVVKSSNLVVDVPKDYFAARVKFNDGNFSFQICLNDLHSSSLGIVCP